ncbi:peroxiredoxin [Novosphingobium sp.]|uniref:peroxiredoxin n=1 Tax=Novosphingobium sp. TaxID=1874826 RepID=UPI0038B78298
MTQNRILAALAAFALLSPAAAHAELKAGATAPDFSAKGALAGKPFDFSLKALLKKGPVVLYFYPKAFTQGCTLEAHAFAESTPEFAKSGATVIGMSNDDIETLKKFSTAECRDKFAVAAATPAVIKAYDVDLKSNGVSSGYTTRTSYVIARNGKIALVHSDMNYADHVKLTLAAVAKLKSGR